MSEGLGQHITSQFALVAGEVPFVAHGKLEEPDHSSCNWYFSREEIEKHSPSRKDGIDIKKEIYFRKSYCTFLQDLGMRLKVPQVTIATAIVFCHRFFLRQSHSKNDRHLVATVCMFLAGKVEETPRPLRDVILISYEIRNKKDPAAVQRIRQKDVYEEQKDLVLSGERLVLATLGFDLNIHHPYKPLVTAIKKYKVAQHALAQVAWNFVNDGLRTSLCLQFKPHHIAAGAIFLAAKFLKVKLPSDGEKVWWQEFEVTPRQLEEVSNQMLELYEQNKVGTGSRTSDLNGSAGTSVHEKPGVISMAHANVATPSENGQISQGKNATADGSLHLPDDKVAAASSCEHDISNPDRTAANVVGDASDSTLGFQEKIGQIKSDYFSPEETTWATKSKTDDIGEGVAILKSEEREELKCNAFPLKANDVQQQTEAQTRVASDDTVGGESGVGQCGALDSGVDDGNNSMVVEPDNLKPLAVESHSEGEAEAECKAAGEATVKPESQVSEQKKHYAALDEINKDRVKAALEKRRKSRGDGTDTRILASKLDFNDEEELLERELESGVEAAVEAERGKQDQSDSKFNYNPDKDMEFVETEKVNQEDSKLDFQPESSQVPAEADKMNQDGKDIKDYPQQECGMEAAAETDVMTQSRKDNKTKNSHRSSSDPFDGKMERTYEPEGLLKRNRPKDEIISTSDRKWPRFPDRTDWNGDSDRTRSKELTEGGELRNGHDQVHSPRSDSRFQQLQAADRSLSPSKQRDHVSHGQHGRRDAVQENKHRHGYSRDHYHHHSHHYQQHRSDADRDRYHHKERDWQDREQKKARHGYGK